MPLEESSVGPVTQELGLGFSWTGRPVISPMGSSDSLGVSWGALNVMHIPQQNDENPDTLNRQI